MDLEAAYEEALRRAEVALAAAHLATVHANQAWAECAKLGLLRLAEKYPAIDHFTFARYVDYDREGPYTHIVGTIHWTEGTPETDEFLSDAEEADTELCDLTNHLLSEEVLAYLGEKVSVATLREYADARTG